MLHLMMVMLQEVLVVLHLVQVQTERLELEDLGVVEELLKLIVVLQVVLLEVRVKFSIDFLEYNNCF